VTQQFVNNQAYSFNKITVFLKYVDFKKHPELGILHLDIHTSNLDHVQLL
jgi:hypothetical protein